MSHYMEHEIFALGASGWKNDAIMIWLALVYIKADNYYYGM